MAVSRGIGVEVAPCIMHLGLGKPSGTKAWRTLHGRGRTTLLTRLPSPRWIGSCKSRAGRRNGKGSDEGADSCETAHHDPPSSTRACAFLRRLSSIVGGILRNTGGGYTRRSP